MAAFLQGLVAGAATAGSRKIQEERAAKIEQQKLLFAAHARAAADAAAKSKAKAMERRRQIDEYRAGKEISDESAPKADQLIAKAFALSDRLGEENSREIFINLDKQLSGLEIPATVEAAQPPGFAPRQPQPTQPSGTTPPIVPVEPAGDFTSVTEEFTGASPRLQQQQEGEGLLAPVVSDEPRMLKRTEQSELKATIAQSLQHPEGKMDFQVTESGAFVLKTKTPSVVSFFDAGVEMGLEFLVNNPTATVTEAGLRGAEAATQLRERVVEGFKKDEAGDIIEKGNVFQLLGEIDSAREEGNFRTARYLSLVIGDEAIESYRQEITRLAEQDEIKEGDLETIDTLTDATVLASEAQVASTLDALHPQVSAALRRGMSGDPAGAVDLDAALNGLASQDRTEFAKNISLIDAAGFQIDIPEIDTQGLTTKQSALVKTLVSRYGAVRKLLNQYPTAESLFISDIDPNDPLGDMKKNVIGNLRILALEAKRNPQIVDTLTGALTEDSDKIKLENYLNSFEPFMQRIKSGEASAAISKFSRERVAPTGEQRVTPDIATPIEEIQEFISPEGPLPTEAPGLTGEDLTLAPKEEQIRQAFVNIQDTSEFKEFESLRKEGRPRTGEKTEKETSIVTSTRTPEDRKRFEELQAVLFKQLQEMVPGLTVQDLAVFGGI